MIQQFHAQIVAGAALTQLYTAQEHPSAVPVSEEEYSGNTITSVSYYGPIEWVSVPCYRDQKRKWVEAPSKVRPPRASYQSRPVRSKSGPIHR